MSREIKFRAWDGKKIHNVEQIDFRDMKVFYGTVTIDGDNIPYWNKAVKLMEFTGLKDKNGKEIYEGDIVEFDDSSEDEYGAEYDILNKAVVVFNDGRWELDDFQELGTPVTSVIGFMNNDMNQEDWHLFISEELTIVGNIYENPELLKETR